MEELPSKTEMTYVATTRINSSIEWYKKQSFSRASQISFTPRSRTYVEKKIICILKIFQTILKKGKFLLLFFLFSPIIYRTIPAFRCHFETIGKKRIKFWLTLNQCYRKHCGKRRKYWLTSIFSFSHNVFYPLTHYQTTKF